MKSLFIDNKKDGYRVDFKRLPIESILDNISKGLYDTLQLNEIAVGFKKALDTSYYASVLEDGSFFSSEQMKVIRIALEEGLDPSFLVISYDGSRLNVEEMRFCLSALKYNVDITEFMWVRNEKGYYPIILHIIMQCLLEGIDVMEVLIKKDDNSFFDSDRLDCFYRARRIGMPLGILTEKDEEGNYLNASQMQCLLKAFRENKDITVFKKKDSKNGYFSELIMHLIDYCLSRGLDIAPFLGKDGKGQYLSHLQLNYISIALEKGIDVNIFKKDVDKNLYFNAMQMDEILEGYLRGIDISQYCSKRVDGTYFMFDQMKEIRLGLEEGLDVTQYNKPLVRVEEAKDFKYSNEDLYFNSLQMEQIRLGLKEGIDVTKYTSPKEDGFYQTADEMKETRNALFMYKDFNEHVFSKKSFFGQTKKGLTDYQRENIRAAMEQGGDYEL